MPRPKPKVEITYDSSPTHLPHILLWGQTGVGKTTTASWFANSVIICTQPGGADRITWAGKIICPTLDHVDAALDLIAEKVRQGEIQNVVLDTVDALISLAKAAVEASGAPGIDNIQRLYGEATRLLEPIMLRFFWLPVTRWSTSGSKRITVSKPSARRRGREQKTETIPDLSPSIQKSFWDQAHVVGYCYNRQGGTQVRLSKDRMGVFPDREFTLTPGNFSKIVQVGLVEDAFPFGRDDPRLAAPASPPQRPKPRGAPEPGKQPWKESPWPEVTTQFFNHMGFEQSPYDGEVVRAMCISMGYNANHVSGALSGERPVEEVLADLTRCHDFLKSLLGDEITIDLYRKVYAGLTDVGYDAPTIRSALQIGEEALDVMRDEVRRVLK